MPQAYKPTDGPERDHTEFVPVIFARSAEDAEIYRELLNDHDIPALLGTEEDDEPNDGGPAAPDHHISRGVPVLVPAVLLDEAGEVIADRESVDEFDLEDETEDEDEFGLGEEFDPDSAGRLGDEDEDEEDEEEDKEEDFLADLDDEEEEEDLQDENP